jgi:predicted N-acetyltransferase YhbS
MSANLQLVPPVVDALDVPSPAAQIRLANERPEDAAAVDALIERAFGPGRYAKVSQRLREGNRMTRSLSFCAFGSEALVGAVRQWPILVGAARGVFLGPIAVEAVWRKHGVGGRLIERCGEAAAEAGAPFILLVGDFNLFGPHGFERVPAGRILMPSPVNPARVLWRSLREGGFDGVEGEARAPRD